MPAVTQADMPAMPEAEKSAMPKAEVAAMPEAEVAAMTEAEVPALTEAEVSTLAADLVQVLFTSCLKDSSYCARKASGTVSLTLANNSMTLFLLVSVSALGPQRNS